MMNVPRKSVLSTDQIRGMLEVMPGMVLYRDDYGNVSVARNEEFERLPPDEQNRLIKQYLISEITAKVDNLRSLGASDSELDPDWIAQDILNDHPNDGVDEFTVCAARATVRKEVLRYLAHEHIEKLSNLWTGC